MGKTILPEPWLFWTRLTRSKKKQGAVFNLQKCALVWRTFEVLENNCSLINKHSIMWITSLKNISSKCLSISKINYTSQLLYTVRPSNMGNNFIQLLAQQNNVVLQVETACCIYYHLAVQQFFLLQKVEFTSLLLCATWKFDAQQGGNMRNKQSQLATQQLLHEKLDEKVAHIT